MVIEIRLCTHNGIRRQNSGRMSKFEKHDKVDFIVYIFTVIYIFVGASLVAQLVKNLPAMQETPIQFLGQEDPWRRGGPCNSVFMGFPGGSDGKESACKGGDLGLIPGSGRAPGIGNGNPPQYSCLENSMNRGAR